MWLKHINNLCIYKSCHVSILTRLTHEATSDFEEIQQPKIALNHQDCEEFLINKALSLQTLKVQGDSEEDHMNIEYLQLRVKSFKILKKLILHQMIVTDEDLQIIGRNCPQLKSLHMIKCFCEHFRDIVPGKNISVTGICDIVQLQELKIEPGQTSVTQRTLNWEYVEQMLYCLQNLKLLSLRNFTIICIGQEENDESYWPSRVWTLEVLNMGLINYGFWCRLNGFLKCCPQLNDLTIHVMDDQNIEIDFKFVYILSKYCKNLKILTLENCELNVKDFSLLQGLQELTLSFCQGLTFDNLQQIFGSLQLKVFKLYNTPVRDTKNCIYISETLESIVVDTVHFAEISEMFQRSLNKFSGLQTLEWLNGDINHKWIVDKCPQLQQLHITNPFHLSRIVSHLKSLRELTVTTVTGLSWSLIKILVFNLSLKRLNIYSTDVTIGENKNSRNSLMKATTLEFIAISYEIFVKSLKYWLELLEVNEHLRIMIYGAADDILNVRLICFLLATQCLRQRYKRIKICGLKLELESLQINTILREIALVHMNTNHYKARKIPFTLEL